MSTIKDVAKLAKVSIGTVSNYINGTRTVTQSTAKKIQDSIDILGFTPNTNARNLKTSSIGNEIAVVLPNTFDSYYSNILTGLENELTESGYNINLALTDDIPENEIKTLNRLISKKICGLVIITCQSENTDYFDTHFFRQNIPVVFIDRKISNPDINFLAFDNYGTITSILSELHDKNFKDIAIMVGQEGYHPEDECIRAYNDFHKKNNLKINKKLINHILPSKESAFRTGIDLIRKDKPKVIIASSSQIGKGLSESANLIGLYSPNDLRIISLGEENWTSNSLNSRNIATMRSSHKLGQEAANTVIANINSPIIFEKHHIYFEDKIVERGIFNNSNKPHVHAQTNKQQKLEALFLSSSDSDAVESLAFDFKNKTGISVNVTPMLQDDLINTILSSSNEFFTKYDIIMYDITWASQLAHIGALKDITSYINSNTFDKSIFIDDILDRIGLHKNKYYGIPFLYSPQMLLYRKDLFDNPVNKKAFKEEYKVDLEPPKTWLMFNAISKFFTKSLNPDSKVQFGTSLAGGMTGSVMPEFYSRLWAYGGDLFDENHKPSFNSPAFLKALTSYKETYDYAPKNALEASIEQTVSDFYTGKAAMVISYASYLTLVTNPSISNVVGKTGYDFVPGGNSVLGCWGLGISSQCKTPDEAFSFLNWACGEEMSNYFTIIDGQSSIEQVYQNDELVNLYPWLPMIYSCYPKCRNRLAPISVADDNIYFLEVERMSSKIIYEYLYGRKTVEQTMNELQEKISSII